MSIYSILPIFTPSSHYSYSTDVFSLDRDFGISKAPYVVTNEANQSQTLAILKSLPRHNQSFHIGFSGWENYNLMVARQSCGALLGDINNTVLELFQKTQDTILQSKNRYEFIDNILLELEPSKERFFREETGVNSSTIRSELEREGSWLYTDTSYAFIRSLYEEGKIAHIRLDVSDRDAFSKISRWLNVNQLNCDSIYLSNIGDWFLLSEDGGRGISKMKASINQVITKDTLIIDASEHFFHLSGPMPQRVIQASPYDPQKERSRKDVLT